MDAAALDHVAGRVVCGVAAEGDPGQRRTRQVRHAGNYNLIFFFFQSDSVVVLCSNRGLQAEVELVLPDTSRLSRCHQLQLTSALISSVCH